MTSIRILAIVLSIGLLAVGCSQEPEMTAPNTQTHFNYDKNGTETLGDPTIAISGGSGFAEGGVGMVGVSEGIMAVEVPAGATINQAILYWVGGTTGAPGDDMIKIDGNDVTGELIGGPTNFFSNYWFSAYRADITAMGLVTDGANSFTISDFDFDHSGGSLDENNGIGMLVIYDDGTTAEISVLDGLDMAYFDFAATLDSTVPQTFTFNAESADRMASMVIFAGSVGVGRPNGIKFTTSAGEDLRSDLLGSENGLLWDSLKLEDILIPAGDTSLTVELISTITELDPVADRGASMAWTAAGFSIPTNPPTFCIGDYVWYDENRNGCQDEGEMAAEGVEVNLWVGCPPVEVIATTVTTAEGYYAFCELVPGDYTVQFMAPDGYYFCEPFSSGCDTANDSNAGEDGITECVTIVDADDWTIDAALCMPEPELACLGDYVWEDLNMDGVQDTGEPGIEGVTVYLMDCQDNQLAMTTTGPDGAYMFCELEPGDYNVKFMLPLGYVFSPMNIGDPTLDSDADPNTGMAACTDLVAGEYDMTWDAGMYMPMDDCEDCDGKVTELTMQYNGDVGGQIVVEQKKDGVVVFNDYVMPGEQFTFVGEDKHGTLGTEIKIFVDGKENTKIHTSCSQPIGPGLVSGDFEVISGYSRNGGLLCPVDWTPPEDDCECDGKVTTLTLEFNGAEGAQIVVEQKKDEVVVFDDYVMPGEQFTFVGEDKHGTLSTEIKIFVDGVENTKIHTSCSVPIGPGLVSGDFLVVDGASRNNGRLCPLEITPTFSSIRER